MAAEPRDKAVEDFFEQLADGAVADSARHLAAQLVKLAEDIDAGEATDDTIRMVHRVRVAMLDSTLRPEGFARMQALDALDRGIAFAEQLSADDLQRPFGLKNLSEAQLKFIREQFAAHFACVTFWASFPALPATHEPQRWVDAARVFHRPDREDLALVLKDLVPGVGKPDGKTLGEMWSRWKRLDECSASAESARRVTAKLFIKK